MSTKHKSLEGKKTQNIYTKREDVKRIFGILEKEFPNIKEEGYIFAPFDSTESEFSKYLQSNGYYSFYCIGNNTKDEMEEIIKYKHSTCEPIVKKYNNKYDYNDLDIKKFHMSGNTDFIVTNPPFNMAANLINKYVELGIKFVLITSNLINTKKDASELFIKEEVFVIGEIGEFKDGKQVPSYIVTNIQQLKKHRKKRCFF